MRIYKGLKSGVDTIIQIQSVNGPEGSDKLRYAYSRVRVYQPDKDTSCAYS